MADKDDKARALPPGLRALADTTRLKIMLMLEGRPRTVGEVVDFFELSQPTITRHLQMLAAAGLVRRRKEAQRVIYESNAEAIRCFCVQLVSCFPCCCETIVVPAAGVKKKQSRKKGGSTRLRSKTKTPRPKGRAR